MKSMKKVSTNEAPKAAGPYSQAIVHSGLVYVSGQIPIDPATGQLPSGIGEQTIQTLKNIESILDSAGSSMNKVLKITLYITDMNLFQQVNSAYEGFFSEPFPARVCVGVSSLPKGAMIEADAVAHLDSQML